VCVVSCCRRVAVICSDSQCDLQCVLYRVAVHCSVVWYVAVCCSVSRCVTVCYSML